MKTRFLVFACCLLLVACQIAEAARLKELAMVEGVRDNQLIGYGIVVGLAGTGDRRQTMFSVQSLTNLLERMGVSVPPTAIQVSNTAAVMLTATLPPFAQTGTRLDVMVAAMGDAKNLQGGMLLLTPLRAADGSVYAAGQGPLVTGGFSASGAGSSQTVNHPTTARIPGGAIVEKASPSLPPGRSLRLQLKQADFTTAARVTAAVNRRFPATSPVAKAENSGAVKVETPVEYLERPVEFLAELEALQVEADRVSRIVINERTGTITLGRDVRISPVSILHGNLTVEIETTFNVSQPQPLSNGETAVVPKSNVTAKEDKARHIGLKEGATVEELVRALTVIGSTPRDIIAILQNLRAAGALEAELEVI